MQIPKLTAEALKKQSREQGASNPLKAEVKGDEKSYRCVKSVCIRSHSGPCFPAFGLNTERYGVMRDEDQNNSEYAHFSRSVSIMDSHIVFSGLADIKRSPN